MATFLSSTPAFPVSDLTASKTFFSDLLGFGVIAEDETFALMERDKVELMLWLSGDDAWKERTVSTGDTPIMSGAESFLAGTASCRTAVFGIEALFEDCDKAGIVHPNGALKRAPYGAQEFSILDPDGNLVTFYEF